MTFGGTISRPVTWSIICWSLCIAASATIAGSISVDGCITMFPGVDLMNKVSNGLEFSVKTGDAVNLLFSTGTVAAPNNSPLIIFGSGKFDVWINDPVTWFIRFWFNIP